VERVGIIGLGLMGGSLGLGLHRRGFSGTVRGYARRAETRALALERGAVDEVHDTPAEAAEGCDLVVLCVPVLSTESVLQACRKALKSGSIVTDVGSTKAILARSLPPLLKSTGSAFIGSHPICGSERQGLEAATSTLYEGAVVAVTPRGGEDETQVERVIGFWEHLGAEVRQMSPEAHDEVLARTSHLPHMVAALLVATVGRNGEHERIADFCGSGFRSATRLAAGSPELWHDISRSNPESLFQELTAFKEQVETMCRWLREEDFGRLREFLASSRDLREALERKSGTTGTTD